MSACIRVEINQSLRPGHYTESEWEIILRVFVYCASIIRGGLTVINIYINILYAFNIDLQEKKIHLKTQ